MIVNTAANRLPTTLLFDWHGTLVNTSDAMFEAMEELLGQLEELDLLRRLVPEHLCRGDEDVKLLRYIRIFRRLHPTILAEARVSRTELFDAMFGADQNAKQIAHRAYNRCYRHYYGKVYPLQPDVGNYLRAFKALGLRLGVATNRSREFLDYELQLVDEGQWAPLFDGSACADDVFQYKPDPELITAAQHRVGEKTLAQCWYIGDSYLDMVTAKAAGVVAVFYNSGFRSQNQLQQLFNRDPWIQPDHVIDCWDGLFELLVNCAQGSVMRGKIQQLRPTAFSRPPQPTVRREADWHPAVVSLSSPDVILFDWHATLVDTLDAMYRALDELLPQLGQLGLLDKLVEPDYSKSLDDARLVAYVQNFSQLHPRIRADRKISRTDIFEVLFGDDQQAKNRAHQLFNGYYRKHYGTVRPFEPQLKPMLQALGQLLPIAVITNRDREFFDRELALVDGGGWTQLFSCSVCGDEAARRKPHPDQLLQAAHKLGVKDMATVWYVGDSSTDVVAAKRAGAVAVFFNGAQWDLPWLEKIFPGSDAFPAQPDVVVNDFAQFWALVLACRNRAQRR